MVTRATSGVAFAISAQSGPVLAKCVNGIHEVSGSIPLGSTIEKISCAKILEEKSTWLPRPYPRAYITIISQECGKLYRHAWRPALKSELPTPAHQGA
jgi:hypothetical protein